MTTETKSALTKYNDAARATTAEWREKIAADKVRYERDAQEVERITHKISGESEKVNRISAEFVRFFIENAALLPPDMQEYVAEWQKENLGTFDQLARLRDELKDALKVQYATGDEIAQGYMSLSEKLAMLGNIFAKHIIMTGHTDERAPRLPLPL